MYAILKPFNKSLARGDLVAATGHRSEKLHLLHLGRSKHELEGKDSGRVDPELRLWDGQTFCKMSRKYYFTPTENVSAWSEEGRCHVCFQRWRAADSPAVKAWTAPIGVLTEGAWPLPFGWSEIPVEGHPWDVPAGGDIEAVRDGEGNVVGELRAERRRWRRGNCVVRLVESLGDDSKGFVALHHDTQKPLHERRHQSGSELVCLRVCWEMMAKGGRP